MVYTKLQTWLAVLKLFFFFLASQECWFIFKVCHFPKNYVAFESIDHKMIGQHLVSFVTFQINIKNKFKFYFPKMLQKDQMWFYFNFLI